MEETTVKVMALIQARFQVQLLSLIAVLSRPIPGVSVGEQWSKLYLDVSQKNTSALGQTGAKQIRLMAELAEETDETRSAELLRELLILDRSIQTGLAELWNIPSRSERSD